MDQPPAPSKPPSNIDDELSIEYLKSVWPLDIWVQIGKAIRQIELSGGAGGIEIHLRPGKPPLLYTSISKKLTKHLGD